MLWRVLKYIQHQFYWKHRKGRSIHSPYLFELVHEVIFNSRGVVVPGEILAIHQELLKDQSNVPSDSMGASSTVDWSGKRAGIRSVGSFVKGSSVSRKSGALLFRIARWLQPEMIIELGTGLGISTLYLARGYAGADVTSFEGNRERAAFAAQLFCRSHMDNISIHWGELDGKLEDFLPQIRGRVLAFMDANHRYLPSLGYARKLIDHAGEDSIIIMDDIYWSRDMYRAWQEIISWTEVRMSIDLFHMGVLILRKDLQKNDVKINL